MRLRSSLEIKAYEERQANAKPSAEARKQPAAINTTALVDAISQSTNDAWTKVYLDTLSRLPEDHKQACAGNLLRELGSLGLMRANAQAMDVAGPLPDQQPAALPPAPGQ
jgi:hypothetical protein